MSDSMGSWLARLALSKYEQLFVENDIDLDALPRRCHIKPGSTESAEK